MRFGRLAAAAGLGALGSLSIFWEPFPMAAGLLFRLSLGGLMAAVALPWEGGWRLARSVLCLLLVSFLFSGGILALQILWQPSKMVVRNGVPYIEFSAAALLAASFACYFLTRWFERLLRRRAPTQSFCEVLLVGEEASSRFRALVDTGNHLVEPFSGDPVLVCERAAVAAALPVLADCPAGEARAGIRFVFFQSVGAAGMLPAVCPQRMFFQCGGRGWRQARGVYLAVIDQPLAIADCRAVMNPQALERMDRVSISMR